MSARPVENARDNIYSIHIGTHIEYRSVCPLVGFGTPLSPPFPLASVPPPPIKGGGLTRLRVRGGGPNFDDWRKSLALWLLYGLDYQRAAKKNRKSIH